jgi:outer membrane protein assembly factor BamB
MRIKLLAIVFAAGLAPVVFSQARIAPASDWTESRGPARDGTSAEKNLPSRWSPAGENVAWTLPFGGRSTPVIHGNRFYIQTTTVGDVALSQERLVAVDATTGKVLWEHKASQFLSDVPQHRAGWASPAVDAASGTIFMFTVSAELFALSPQGKVLWKRSLPEEYGAITTHGGRTTSPIVEGNMVILNALLQGWGDLGRPGNRYFAFDKTTGQTIWISAPQSRHYDTNYSSPIVADINGMRQLIVGGTDGVFHGLKVNTGQPVWSIEVSKRAILNSPLYRDNTVYIAHGEENIDTTEMGMIAAVDATGTGVLTGAAIKWKTHNFLPTFASPVMDGERLYGMDNSAILGAFDLKTGKELWTKTLGTLQKGSPTLADGKLYIGTENGKFYIILPSATGAEVLDEDVVGDPIIAAPAVANGRVFVTSMEHVYAIGPKQPAASAPAPALGRPTAAPGEPAAVQVFPYEALLNSGESQAFSVKLFDAKGNFVREAKGGEVTWATDQLAGTVDAAGKYTAPADGAAGYVKATVGTMSGQARVRVIPPLPWSFDFEGMKAAPMWWTSNLKGVPRDVGGSGVLVRPRDDTVGRRTRFMMGRPDWSDYTVEADVRGLEMRRQRGDVGLINQRYVLMLFGNNQKLELQPWQAANEMTVSVDNVPWEVNTWYRMKLRVQNRPDGTTLAQGKVWKRDEPEPAKWLIEKVDRIPHRAGAPGIYGDGYSDVFFDNVKVYKNQ